MTHISALFAHHRRSLLVHLDLGGEGQRRKLFHTRSVQWPTTEFGVSLVISDLIYYQMPTLSFDFVHLYNLLSGGAMELPTTASRNTDRANAGQSALTTHAFIVCHAHSTWPDWPACSHFPLRPTSATRTIPSSPQLLLGQAIST